MVVRDGDSGGGGTSLRSSRLATYVSSQQQWQRPLDFAGRALNVVCANLS